MAETYTPVPPGMKISTYDQPGNGVLDPNLFTETNIPSTLKVGDEEFTSALLISIASVYLFRLFKLKIDPKVVFKIGLKVAETYSDHPNIDYTKNWKHNSKVLLTQVKGLDDDSIVAAVRLAAFNSYYSDVDAGIESLKIGAKTIRDIKNITQRIFDFADSIGAIEDGSILDYSNVKAKFIFITTVDRYFVSGDTFWHIKAFRPHTNLDKIETLELLVFYLFGAKSTKSKEIFAGIKKLGIFDARTSTTFVINISDIPEKAITETEQKVIGFL